MTNEQKLTWVASFSHLITHGYMTLLPGVLVVIAGDHSMSFMEIGIIANIGYFLYGLGAFLAGYLADKLGSKRILTIGVIGMASSSILVGLSPSTITFAMAYALLGLFASIHHPAGLSLIARRITVKKGKALGLHGVFGNIGLFLTPLAAALCIMVFGTWRSAYFLFGLIGFVFSIVLHLVRIDSEPDLNFRDLMFWKRKKTTIDSETAAQQQKDTIIADPKQSPPISIIPVSLLLLYVGSIFSGLIFRGSLTFFPVMFKEHVYFIANHDEPVVIAGFVTTAVLSFGLIGSWFGGYLNDKVKTPELFPVIIFIIVAPTLYLISRFTDSWLLAFSALFCFVYYAWQPSHNYLISKYTRKASHGMGFGINFFLIFGIGSIATAIGGYMADTHGIDMFYGIMSIIALCSLMAAITVIAVKRQHIRFAWQLVKEDD